MPDHGILCSLFPSFPIYFTNNNLPPHLHLLQFLFLYLLPLSFTESIPPTFTIIIFIYRCILLASPPLCKWLYFQQQYITHHMIGNVAKIICFWEIHYINNEMVLAGTSLIIGLLHHSWQILKRVLKRFYEVLNFVRRLRVPKFGLNTQPLRQMSVTTAQIERSLY